ncbi:MAG: efflux RND transporter periplasmic adaptor subunit [Saprospiraceae bacterium]|jgi:membrane fusion protein (multidrug efflux system)|nr:efflux RND transporter periplasmic adaptor subunit [Saprospiraceae bacterium]
MKKTLCLLHAVAALFFTACSGDKTNGADKPARSSYDNITIEGFIVKPATLTATVTAAGTLLPMEETELHTEATGRVVAINLPEGKTVNKGDLLIKIFDQDLQTQLRTLETRLKQAEITEQRLGDLLKVKGVSQQEYDLAALEVQTLKNEMELVRINIGKTELRAPYAGVIGLRRISPGAYVTPASPVATIRSSGTLKLDFSVPEKYGHLVRPGQTVTFTVEGDARTHTAVLQATEQSIAAETRNLQVRALVQNKAGGNLLPGGFAEVSLDLGKQSKALMIPTQSIVPQAREKIVFVNRGGVAVPTPVKTGVRQSGMVEITEGLAEGDTIATTGILFLRPKAAMKFSKVE